MHKERMNRYWLGGVLLAACLLLFVADADADEILAPSAAPVAVCSPYSGVADGSGCTWVDVWYIDGGSYDPDGLGDIDDICISAVDGAPVGGCPHGLPVCGVGPHTVTLRVTDMSGAFDECDAPVEVTNEPPEARCRPYTRVADPSGCVEVRVEDIDDGSYDPEGLHFDLCITDVDGTPVGCVTSTDVCGVGMHTVRLRITDQVGEADFCDALVEVVNEPPVARCRSFSRLADGDGCIDVEVDDINDGSYDPEGMLSWVCIVAVDGIPAPCATEVEVCGVGTHTVTLAAIDHAGASDSCEATVEVINHPPVAECRSYGDHPDASGCTDVNWMDVDDGSYDPDGIVGMICISAVDGVPAGCVPEVQVCGAGMHTVTLRITDHLGEFDECDASVEVVNRPPVARCGSYVGSPDPGTCSIIVGAGDIDDGSYDPDGDPLTRCISAVDGVPTGCVPSVTVSGDGWHDVTLRVTDPFGLSDECVASVEIDNIRPVAWCRDYSDHPTSDCCISVDVSDIDDGSYDPDGSVDLCITHVDGADVGCLPSVQVCGVGMHAVTLRATDACGESDQCVADVEVVDSPPLAFCRPYAADADETCCIQVAVADIDDGSYDPDGPEDVASLLITQVDGAPVTPADQVEVCGQGLHTVRLTITDRCGLSHWCDTDVEVINRPPVALCKPYVGEADEDCCITVTAAGIDDGSYDPDGAGDIKSLCITAIDGAPVGCREEVEICGVGTYAVTLTVTDWCGETDQCDAQVQVIDVTPPEITLTLDRYVLWPPNHKMASIGSAVTVEDNCDPDPYWEITSITSNEPVDDGGEGKTVPDWVADFGTPDIDFLLRSERSGKGSGRIYTIVYTARDFSGNSAAATAEVTVPHDQSGMALASAGFTEAGTGLNRSQERFALIIPSKAEVYGTGRNGKPVLLETDFDATKMDESRVYVGNCAGVLSPVRTYQFDQNGDGLTDLAVFYQTCDLEPLVASIVQTESGETWVCDPIDPVGIHYQSTSGIDYLVPDIFMLGAPVAVGPSGSAGVTNEPTRAGDVPEGTGLMPAMPNPFTGRTAVRFDLATEEHVTLHVYDAAGRLVATLADRVMPVGTHQAVWDGRDSGGRSVVAGFYFLRFTAGSFTSTQKMMLVK